MANWNSYLILLGRCMFLDLLAVGRYGTKEQLIYQHVIINGQIILISDTAHL